ncbi:MAG: polyprenyl diphosphate synthase, partial [Desulfomonilaceae bacterium]|nr:polyprenyl diphosphate synthase [Desulfomonilaceae bacterium]
DLLMEHGVRLGFLGDRRRLPVTARRELERVLDRTSGNRRGRLNLALNYGGRDEVVRAARSIARDVSAGRLDLTRLDEHTFASRLDTAGLPDPDLLIRTGGEMRVSNFLLWQTAYTELWFTPVYWPDFDKTHLTQAILDYRGRRRRFGALDPGP